jgi:hypothetical protein
VLDERFSATAVKMAANWRPAYRWLAPSQLSSLAHDGLRRYTSRPDSLEVEDLDHRRFSVLTRWKIALLCVFGCVIAAQAQETRVVLVAPPGPVADRALLEVARQLPKVTFVSSRDPDILALSRVPFSARPILALGRFSPEGRLVDLTWQASAAEPKAAVAELTAHLQDEASRPRLQQVSLQPGADKPLREGEMLAIRATGTPSSEVTYQLGSAAPQAMLEERPGFYVATYRVQASDAGDTPVRVALTNSRGSVAQQAGTAWLQGVAPPQVDQVEQIGTRRWRLAGRTAPNARVEGTLWLEGRERRFDTRSDATGRFAEEFETRRFIASDQGQLALSVTTEGGFVSQAEPQSIRFIGDEAFRPVRVRAVGGYGFGAPWGWGGGWGGWPGAWGGGCGPWGPWGGGWGW